VNCARRKKPVQPKYSEMTALHARTPLDPRRTALGDPCDVVGCDHGSSLRRFEAMAGMVVVRSSPGWSVFPRFPL